MTIFTPEEARAFDCPTPGRTKCVAQDCILWRWLPLLANEPAWMAAVQKAKADGVAPKEAAQWVNDRREELGLPAAPYRGWCGLGGEPKA